MLPDHHRLARRSDITSALRRGRRRGSPLLVVHVAPSPRPGPTRAAFAVSSAVGNSVIRHRITRRLRAAVLPLLDQLPEGTDLVIRALPPAKDATYTELDDELQRLLNLRPRDRQTAVPTPVPEHPVPEHPVPEHPVPEHPVPEHPVQEQPGSARTGLGRVLYVIGSPLRWLLIGLVMVYRKVISPVLPPTCRYHPSCSAYALESLQVHGAAKGFVLAVWRVLRCNPFTRGGLDPVPERGAWHPPIYPDGSPRDPGAVGLPGDRGNISPVPTTDPAP